MNQFLEWLSRIFGSWKFWIIVPPWDIGVRVRFGKVAATLVPGIHFRIPFIDEIILINTRIRIVTPPSVTVDGGGNRTRVLTATVGYRLSDPVKAMLSFSESENAVMSLTQAAIAGLKSESEVKNELASELSSKGIQIDFVRYVEDVHVRTYRLLNDTWKLSSYGNGAPVPVGSNNTARW